MLRIRVLGPLTLTTPDGSEPDLSPSVRQLLAVLVAAGPTGVTQSAIAEELWGEELPASWQSAFRNGLARLRSKVGKSHVTVTSGRLRLTPESVSVDAWELVELADADRACCPETDAVATFLQGTPFDGLEISPALRLVSDRIEVARLSLIHDIVRDPNATLDRALLAAMRSHLHRHPFDDGLLELVARAHVHAGEAARAMALLRAARVDAETDERLTSPRIAALEESIHRKAEPGALLATAHRDVANQNLPEMLRTCLDDEQIGRATELNDVLELLATSRCVLVTGQIGTGKTSLIAAAASHLVDAGHCVLYASAQGADDASYATVLSAVPTAALSVRTILDNTDDAELTHRLCCVAIAQALKEASDQRCCLVLDDTHALDSHSERFVEFMLAQDEAEFRDITILLAARSEVTTDGWVAFEHSLGERRVPTVFVNVLDRHEMVELARSVHPAASMRLAIQLADEVLALTGGLPGVARFMMQTADRDSLLLDERDLREPSALGLLVTYTRRLSSDAAMVGTAGAVLGHSFAPAQVGELLDCGGQRLVAACTELIEHKFVRHVADSADSERLSFVHALNRQAMLDRAEPPELRELHRAAALLAPSLKQQARHYAAAVPLVSEAVACRAMIDAGHLYFDEGSWREAAASLRDANRRCPDALAIDDLTRFAAALDLSGADGTVEREAAFRAAAAAKDWPRAIGAAVSGLPAAERLHGDEPRVALLQAIPRDQLSQPDQFLVASMLVRHLMFLGEDEAAEVEAERARQVASTPTERLHSFIADTIVGAAEDPTKPRDVPAEFDQVENPVDRLRGLQISTLSHLERSPADVASRLVGELDQLTSATNDPYRTWHMMSLHAMQTLMAGDDAQSEGLAEQARRHGFRYGIGDAETGYLGHLLFSHWLRNDIDLLRTEQNRFEAAGTSLLNQTLTVMVRNARCARSSAVAEQDLAMLVDQAVASNSFFSVAALVFIVEEVAPLDRPDLARTIVERLQPRAGTSAIMGNGVFQAGPVDRALGLLTNDEASAAAHHRAAMALADAQQLRVWQVKCRLDLAALGDTDMLGEAQDLATTPLLKRIVDGIGV